MKTMQIASKLFVTTLSIALVATMLGGCSSSKEKSSAQHKKSEDIVYENKEAGFSAAFPSKPEERIDSTGNEIMAFDQSFPDTPSFTYVWVMNQGLEREVQEYAGGEWLDTLNELLTFGLSSLTSFKPTSKEIHPDHGSWEGYPCVYLMAPFTVTSNESETRTVNTYGYALAVASETNTYIIYGSRPTEAEAQKALDSFKLV